MQVKCWVVAVSVIFFSLNSLFGQSSVLENTLVDIANAHQLSIVFNPATLPSLKEVPSIDQSWTVTKKLKVLLRGTNLEFKIDKEEIFLFKRRIIYGYIEDAESKERLIAATLYIPSTGAYTVANEQGYFNISTLSDSLSVVVSYLGYSDKRITIDEDQMDKPKTIQMSIDNTIEEIVISNALFSSQEKSFLELEKGSNVLLYQNSASTAIGGEPDIFQAIFRQTGVTTGVDGVGGIHVRGGKSGHNQVLLDGMKIHYPNHSFGLYSVINSNIVEQATLHKTGSAGPFSGSTASILDVKSKDPVLNSFKAYGQFSSIASQAGLNIPLGKKVALRAVGRLTHVDPIVRALTEESKANSENIGSSNLYFNDIHVKGKWDVNQRLKLFGSGFYSIDGYNDTNLFEAILFDEVDEYIGDAFQDATYAWDNSMWQLRVHYILTENTFAKASLGSYTYKYFSNFEQEFEGNNSELNRNYYLKNSILFNSGLTSYQARLDFETALKNSNLKYGIHVTHRIYNLGLYSQDSIPESESPYEPIPERELSDFFIGDRLATESTGYLVHQWKPKSSIFIESALYFTYLNSRDQEDTFYEYNPDLLLNYGGIHGYVKGLYKWNEKLLSGFNAGTSIQTEHLLSPADNSYPNDIWIPATPYVRPQRTFQAELFSKASMGKHELTLTGYAKNTVGVNLVSSLPPILTLSEFLTDEWEEDIITGNLISFGIELSYGIQTKYVDLLANYSYMHANYIFDELNDGIPFPYDYSIPHTLSVRSQIQLSKRWTCALDWYYSSGKPFTLYSAYFRYQPLDRGVEQEVEPISGFNDYLLPLNHKLSISFSTFWKWGKVRNDLSMGIQNVYNRQNVIYAYSVDEEIQDFTGFPILPMLTYRISL